MSKKGKGKDKETRPLLRAFGIFIAIILLFMLYAYAIDVTQINFEEPQDPQRQATTTRVIRALARPDFFEYNVERRSMNIGITVPCDEAISGSQFSLADGRTATISPNCASTTQDQITLNGTGFRPRTDGIIRWHPPGTVVTTRALSSFRTDGDGSFTAQFTMPDIRESDEPQRIEIEEQQRTGGFLGTGIIGWSEASKITFEKIIETVLLALMATTVGTILAIPLSFMAARNLMENVGLPLAAIMSSIIGLGVSYFAGSAVTTILLGWAASITSNTFVGLVIAGGLLVLAWVVIKIGPAKLSDEERTRRSTSIGWLRVMFALTAVFFAILLLGYVGMVFGEWLTPSLGTFAFIGRFISFLAEGITILSPFVVGVFLGLMGAVLGSTYGQEAILRSNDTVGRVFTAVTTGIGAFAFIYAIGAFLNWLYQFDEPLRWTLYPAIIGAIIGAIGGLIVKPRRQFPIGFWLYTVMRSLLNLIRSIEPLIYVIVFAVWVGIGPFAGVLALTIHTVASLGKLYSEQVEGIAEGPLEAITATGANRLQTIVFAVVPQVVPPFIAFTLYRWDINVRFSTVIGFAGGGGIGFVLVQNINLLQYRQAAVMMLAIAVVVITLDYISSKVRSRII